MLENGLVEVDLVMVMYGMIYLKHRIVAIQFLPNPTNEPHVDHKNGVRTDNHITNLLWCSRSDNMRNRNSIKGKPFNYIDELPDTATPLTSYNNHQLEHIYIDPTTKNLYLFNGARIRVLERIAIKDVNGKNVMLDRERLLEEQTYPTDEAMVEEEEL